VRNSRMHRREEKVLLATEALIKDRFRDAGGLRNLACRRGMTLRAKDVARDPEHFVVGNRLVPPHAAQCIADINRVPARLGQTPNRSTSRTSWEPLDK